MSQKPMVMPDDFKSEMGGNLLSISQSLIKNYWSYKEGKYCGIAFHKMDILKMAQKEATPKMKLGQYFEYLCTGETLRDGSIPEEPLTKTKKPTAEGKRMQEQAKRFVELLKSESIEIDDTGVVLETPFSEYGFKLKGVLDILGSVDGIPAIIDIKSSGLIGNEWEAYGWHSGTFNMRKHLNIQVVFYKYLAWHVLGIKDMPFYYIIHSTTNSVDSLFWEVKLKDFDVAMSHFEDMIFETVEEIQFNMELGFSPYPTVKGCAECPLNGDCLHKITTPKKEVVEIDGIFEQ